MPDERETPTPPENQEREASLDQETLDALVGDSGSEDTKDLESLLSNLDGVDDSDEGPSEGEADASDMDNMEALIDQMESDVDAPAEETQTDEAPSEAERDEMNDLLYQDTIADVDQADGEPEESATDEQEESTEDDLESLLSDLDGQDEPEDLATLLDETDDSSDVEASSDVDSEEIDEDPESLLAELDGEDVSSTEEIDTDDTPEKSTEEVVVEDLESVLEETADEDVSSGEGEEDLAGEIEALLEDDKEVSDADETQEGSGDEETAATDDTEEDLDALLEGLDTESAESEDVEAEIELELEPAEEDDTETPEPEVEETTLESEDGSSDESTQSDEDVSELDLDEAKDNESPDDQLDELIEDIIDEDAAGDSETEEGVAEEEVSEEDVAELLGDDETLLEDVDAGAEDKEEESEEGAGDLDDLLDDLDSGALDEASDEDSDDLDSLLDGLDDSDAGDDVSDEMSLDLDEEGDDDLDSMFDDLDTDDESPEEVDATDDDDLGDLFDENLNVGVEKDVAHILATGEPAPESGDDSLLDDDILDGFKSVQESIVSGGEEAGSITGTIMLLDDDEDNRTLFKDALDVSDETYNYIEVDTTDKALETLSSQNASLILMNLDGNTGDAASFLKRLSSSQELPSIPIVVNSTENDQIEEAIRAGATDYFSRPLDVMDVEYQVPKKISNLIKLQKAEHLLAEGLGDDQSATDSQDSDDLGLDSDMDEFDDLMLDDGIEDEDDALRPEDLIAGVSSGGGGAATATRKKGKKRLIPITDQRRMIRGRERNAVATRDRSRKLPLILGMALLVIFSAGLSAVAVNYVMNQRQQEVATVTPAAPPKPATVLQQPKFAQKDFEMAKQRTERPNTFQRQADEAKIRIRRTVQELESSGGAWWSPWRVMRSTGVSLDRLVNRRQVSDIMDAFGVNRATVNAGLGNSSTLDYLASVGFDMRGKSADELNARETFELLSARQIKNTNQIVDILSSLQDKLAKDRAQQARRRAKQKKTSETAALDRKPEVSASSTYSTASIETHRIHTSKVAQFEPLTEHHDFWRST
ncbi:MAG: hypothetical protein CME25_05765 [Gemmatimonadetes bacterium]|nr:hypothetical protein [Gemmatimonadota bacterium]